MTAKKMYFQILGNCLNEKKVGPISDKWVDRLSSVLA